MYECCRHPLNLHIQRSRLLSCRLDWDKSSRRNSNGHYRQILPSLRVCSEWIRSPAANVHMFVHWCQFMNTDRGSRIFCDSSLHMIHCSVHDRWRIASDVVELASTRPSDCLFYVDCLLHSQFTIERIEWKSMAPRWTPTSRASRTRMDIGRKSTDFDQSDDLQKVQYVNPPESYQSLLSKSTPETI